MTGDEHREGIRPTGTTHGTQRERLAYGAGDLAVTARLAGLDPAQLPPNPLLKNSP